MPADVIPFRGRPAPAPRVYQVRLDEGGRVSLLADGDVVDVFSVEQAGTLAALLGSAAILGRGEEDVREGRVAVARGELRVTARLVEHRGTAVRLDLGPGLDALWFSLTDGVQVDRPAASRRWVIEEPHRKALRLRPRGAETR